MRRIPIDHDKLIALLEAPSCGLTLDHLMKMGIKFYAELGCTETHSLLYDMSTGLDAIFSRPNTDPKKRNKSAR